MLAAVLAASFPTAAQPPDRVVRIGFLAASGPERERRLLESFQQGLRELGYREGVNFVIEERYAGGRFERLPELAAELLKRRADILLVAGAPAAQAAKRVTTTVPIVMTNAADPVGTGLVASLARPGGNVTGLSDFNEGVVAKRLALVKEIIPSASRVAVLYNPGNPTNPLQLKMTQDAARTLGITVIPLDVRTAEDLDRASVTIQKERPQALLAIGDPALGSLRAQLVQLAAKHRLPATFSGKDSIDLGGLMSYGTRFEDLYRRAASYVDRIVKGASPADLPIEQPSTFEFVLNLRTARALGLTIPPAVVLRADRVIE
jgi:putative ABC transport system substrate-binding protein